MLFIVPDLDPADDSGMTGETASAVKVELDLDDAPFLEEPEEEKKKPEPEPVPAAVRKAEPDAAPTGLKAFFSNKKRVGLAAAGLLLLLIAPLGINLLFFNKPSAPPVAEVPAQPVPETPVAQPSAPASPSPGLLYSLEGFLVPLTGSEGQIGFLRCRFVVPAKDPALLAELQAKNIVVRDAVYYYLSNKPVTLLSDKRQADSLKRDLLSVINEHVGTEKIEELFIEEYLITGL